MPRKRRKHSIIDKLPPELKATVEEMMKSDFTYQEIADYIKSQTDQDISITSVWRYASNLNESVEALRMAQENFRVIMEEMNKYPALDTTEGIIRLLSHNVLESIQNTPEERWQQINPEQLIKQATALVKAASYKKNLDIKNEDILSAGFEQVKTMVFEAMAKERPDLYADVAQFLNQKRSETQ
ncbi:MAG: phage protein Gp27 family protein [Oscillospiraceae bacterium]